MLLILHLHPLMLTRLLREGGIDPFPLVEARQRPVQRGAQRPPGMAGAELFHVLVHFSGNPVVDQDDVDVLVRAVQDRAARAPQQCGERVLERPGVVPGAEVWHEVCSLVSKVSAGDRRVEACRLHLEEVAARVPLRSAAQAFSAGNILAVLPLLLLLPLQL